MSLHEDGMAGIHGEGLCTLDVLRHFSSGTPLVAPHSSVVSYTYIDTLHRTTGTTEHHPTQPNPTQNGVRLQ